MKPLLLFCLLFPLLLHAQGMQFERTTLDEALKKAGRDNKYVFIDAYTSWCGPCALMATKVFPNERVGHFYNTNFVNLRVDMEQGEGPDLAKKYHISVYPTLLFLDTEGRVVHRVSGYYKIDEFMDLGKTALDADRNLMALERKFSDGDRNPELVRALLMAMSAACDPDTGKIMSTYLRTQDDPGTRVNMDLIYQYADDPFSFGFRYMVHNRKKFIDQYQEKPVLNRIDRVFENYLQQHPNLPLGEVQRLFGTVYPEQGERLASAYRLSYYLQRSDHEHFAEAAIDHYKRYPTEDVEELNEIAWNFSQQVSNPDLLKVAVEWALKSIALHETNYNQETLALLYAKLGKKKAAIKAAKRSIELANAVGEDPVLSKALLERLEREQ
jgi:thioredoxin-related protein